MLLVSEGMEQASESGEERPVESDHSEFNVELSGDEDSEDIAGRIPTTGKIKGNEKHLSGGSTGTNCYNT